MSTIHILQTIFEICLVAFTIWGIFNEQKFIDFEEKIITKLKARKSR